MAIGLRIMLLIGCVGAALACGAIVFAVTLSDADNSLVAALEGKAVTHARAIQQDVQIALDMGIPLEDIRQASEYLEAGAEEDADIRFATLTNLDLQRLHYGGIGRRRLDPLLAAPALRDAMAADPNLLTVGIDGVVVDGFSLTAVPLAVLGEPVGFVIVAVQDKQVRDELLVDMVDLLPALVGVLLLIAEVAMATARSAYEAPLGRLANLMERVVQARKIEQSARHDRTEVGVALLRFNGIVHRLTARAQRVLMLADEVQRAVFDARIATEVTRRSNALRTTDLMPLLTPPVSRADARSSDIHLTLTLLIAGGILGLIATGMSAPVAYQIWTLGGLAVGILLVGAIGSPGWGLVLAGLLQTVAAVWLWRPDLGPAVPELATGGLAAGVGAALAAGLIYRRRCPDQSPVWLLSRLTLGCAAGGLIAWTIVLEDRGQIVPMLVLAAVGLAIVAVNREPVVRGLLFDRRSHTGEG